MDAIISEYKKIITENEKIKENLKDLPKGYLSYKNIHNKTYCYMQHQQNGKIKSEYIKQEKVEDIKDKLQKRKKHEETLSKNKKRMKEIEKASKIIGGETNRVIMLLKLSEGMDALNREEREEAFKFADAITRMEGVPASEKTDSTIRKWVTGDESYFSLFLKTLKKYNLISEEIN